MVFRGGRIQGIEAMSDINQNWLVAAALFAPVMAVGFLVVYRLAQLFWRDLVGDDRTGQMRKSCTEGVVLGLYGLAIASLLQMFFDRRIVGAYLAGSVILMTLPAGAWRGHRWVWFWRSMGYVAILLLGTYVSLIG